MGELHLEVLCQRLVREYKVQLRVGRPEVAYRETIAQEVEHRFRFKRMTGGPGMFAEVDLLIRPGEPGTGVLFDETVRGGSIPREYIPAVEKGVREAAEEGVLAGYPVTDVEVILRDGLYHENDSSEMAFKVAGSMAFREGALKAKPVLLEPIMKVEVVTPEDYMGDVMGDLNRRRGIVKGMEDIPTGKQLSAEVPLSEMFGYSTDLRSMSQGRATYTMQFDNYAEAPKNIVEALTKNQTQKA